MEICNGDLLQLIECIESMKNDVKRKMSLRMHPNDVPKSLSTTRKEKSTITRAQLLSSPRPNHRD
jgi:hypothetical protein